LRAAVGVGDLTQRPRCNTTVDYENFLADDRLGPRAGFQTTSSSVDAASQAPIPSFSPPFSPPIPLFTYSLRSLSVL
jgi:hypothetical protein